jgi:hypothetical protein
MVRHTTQPGAPYPAPAVRRHDDQVDLHFPRILRECRAGGSSQRHRRGQPNATLPQPGLNASEIRPFGLPGQRFDRREQLGGGRVDRCGRQFVHQGQAQLATRALRNL